MRLKLLLVIIAICLSGTAHNSIFAQSSTPSESSNATEVNVSNPFKVTKPQDRRTLFKQRLQYNEDIGIAVPPRFSENEQIWIEYVRNNFPFNPRQYFIYNSSLDSKKPPIMISFLVHKDGAISEPIIVQAPKMKLKRLQYFFKRMPRWLPAINLDGEPVDAYYTMQLDEKVFYDSPEQYIRYGNSR